MYSPRPSQEQQILAEQFAQEREKLRQEIGQQLRQNMASIIGHQPTADLLLVSADGRKMPAHLCILKRRAPSFFQRYVFPTLEAITPRNTNRQHRELLEICVGDVDSVALEFIRSIYTDEEVSNLDFVQTNSDPEKDHPDENGPSEKGDYGSNGNNDQQNWHTLPSLKTTNSSSTFQDRGGQNQQNSSNMPEMMSASFPSPSSSDIPIGLISFRELATVNKTSSQQQLAMNLPEGNEDVPKVGSDKIGQNIGQGEERSKQQSASIFPYFVDIGTNQQQSSIMTRSLPCAAEEAARQRPGSQSSLGTGLEQMATSIRNRAIAARRLSASSANSLTSIDLPTPGQEFQPFGFPTADQIGPMASTKLGEDLLQILEEDTDLADARLIAADGEELAHTAILWASESEFFRQQISALKFAPSPGRRCKIEMRRFGASSLHFFLQFIYGGICNLPSQNDQNSLDLWELVELGAFTKINLFIRLIVLHIRATFCHFFHRPCASCVSAVFDALPKMELEIPEIKNLFDEALLWQAANFTRIWKGRVFLHLADHWQKRCRDALLQSVDEENVIDVLLGCEKLQLTLPRIKLQGMAQKVLKAVNDVEEYCLEFLANSLDSLIQSNAFCSYGRGLALNLTLLEDILPPIIHSLSAETTIRSFLALKELLIQLEEKSRTTMEREISGASSCTNSPLKKPQPQSFGGSNRSLLFGSNQSIISAGWRDQFLMDEWNPRFKCLCRRLLDLLDQHMIHYANSIVNSTEWNQLNADEQNRIHENGLFVEMRMPRMAPPRLSSAGRSYKRSSSVGFSQLSHPSSNSHERTRSLERKNSLRYGNQIAGSRPSLSTQMEEEYCESISSRNDKESEEEQEIRPKMTMKGTNETQKTEKLGTKIPAKIAQQKIRNKNAKNVEMKKEATKLKDGQNVKEIGEQQIVERKLKMKQKIERKSREMGESNNSDKKLTSINQLNPKKIEISAAESSEKCEELEEKGQSQSPQQPERCPPTPPIHSATSNANAIVSASEEIVDSPKVTMNERQLTHTVMTVDQNIRAGINAYLERIGGPTASSGPIVPSSIQQKNGTKPQSIVRPMPKMNAMTAATTATESMTNTTVENQRESRRKTNSRNSRIMGNSMGQRSGMNQQTKISGIRRPMTTAIKK